MWPILEIRHFQNMNFYFPSVFQWVSVEELVGMRASKLCIKGNAFRCQGRFMVSWVDSGMLVS